MSEPITVDRAIRVLTELIRELGVQPVPADFVGTEEQEAAISLLMQAVVWDDRELLGRLEASLEALNKEVAHE